MLISGVKEPDIIWAIYKTLKNGDIYTLSTQQMSVAILFLVK